MYERYVARVSSTIIMVHKSTSSVVLTGRSTMSYRPSRALILLDLVLYLPSACVSSVFISIKGKEKDVIKKCTHI